MPSTRNHKCSHARRVPLGLLVLLGLAVMILGCMMGDDAGYDGEFGADAETSQIMEAQGELARHRVDQAQAIYNQIISEQPNPPGQAFAGKAITDLLMLPGSSEVSALLIGHLGAAHPVDANALFYADDGLFYWVVRGVSWEDQGSYKGVRSLISARLPWSQEQLSGTQNFFGGLSNSLNLATADLTQLADSMGSIQLDIERALQDEYFDSIYIPGLTFHSERLDLFLGRAELQLLSATVAWVRAGLYFLSAYDYDFSLDDALGSQTPQRQDPQQGWGVEDYAHAFLDARVLRQVDSPERLLQAREALEGGLDSTMGAIRDGMGASWQTSIRWDKGNPAHAEQILGFLGALRASLAGPAVLPGSSPETTLDLSSFFEGGRVLDGSIDWFERVVDPEVIVSSQNDQGEWVETEYVEWVITEDAAQAFFLDGVFDPAFETRADAPTIEVIDDKSGDEYFDAILGPLLDRMNEVF